MIFLTDQEKRAIKELLSVVLTDDELKTQFEKASRIARTSGNDHEAGTNGVYAGILKEVMDQRSQRRSNKPTDWPVGQGVSIEAFRKKFSGPK